MTKSVSAAKAKAQLSALVAEVASGNESVVIERRGKPVAALVGLAHLERMEQDHPISSRPRGALCLVGAWREVADSAVDSVIEEIYRERERDTGRPVDIES